MTIWINNPFDFLPGEGARLQRYGLLCRALSQAGHRVIWWSSDWSHFKKEKRTPRQGEAVPRRGNGGGPEIRLIKTMSYFKNVGLRRLLSHWLYAKRWEREALRCEQADRPDLILCSAPPLSTGWVMRGLCQHFACKGVVDVMDLWPETFERVAPAWMLWPLRWMAKRVYQGADGISAVGDSYLNVVKGYLETPRQGEAVPRRTPRQGEAVPRKPMYRCYHGIEKVAVGSTSRQLGQWTEVGGNCPLPLPTANLKLVYVGNMGRGYDLETLVRAVVELIDEGYPIDLDLAGSGEQEPLLKSLAATKINAIRFHGVVMGDHLQELLEQADLGVVPMFPGTVVAVPYKLADYVASGLPVVNSLPGETKALLEQFACGWQYEEGSVVSLKQALKEVYDLKLRDVVAFDVRRNNARRLAEECFDAARIYPAFVRWLEGLLRPHSHLRQGYGGQGGHKKERMYRVIKRVMDIVLSGLALLVLSPLLLPIAIALRCTGEHYVFYYQERIGYKNKKFKMIKFATMLLNSPNLPGGLHTTRKDPRLLPLGGFLRKTKINELPQLLNILKGDMSIVGPRPLVDKTFDPYPEEVKKVIYNVRPGLTGVGSIVFRDEEEILSQSKMPVNECYAKVIAPHKGALELWYLKNISLATDLKLIFLTAWVIVCPKSKLMYKLFRGLPLL